MKLMAAAAAALIALVPAPAAAWGAYGHQYVGNLAWSLLNDNAKAQVRALLGNDAKGRPITLGAAAVWPDCLRGVKKTGAARWTYGGGTGVCPQFGNVAASKREMEAYVGRNWDNCEYAGENKDCHKAFHFSDVNAWAYSDYQHVAYKAPDSDVVWGIRAAIVKLQCETPMTACPIEGPFVLQTHREALFLLAHLVGDVHQPLHVGAVFLDDADAPTKGEGRKTVGGNWLFLTPGDDDDNLHHAWDEIADDLGTRPTTAAIAAACKRMGAADAGLDRPSSWASESVAAARPAYEHLTFADDPTIKGRWAITFEDRKTYDWARDRAQRDRLEAAGVRLAEVLNAVWPSAAPIKGCQG